MRHHSKYFTKIVEKNVVTEKKATRKAKAEKQHCNFSLRAAFKDIKQSGTAPLLHTTEKVVSNGKTVKKIVCKPAEVDRVVREAWAEIRKGKISQANAIIENFLKKYDGHLYKSPEYQIGDINAESLFEELTQHSNSVGGLDGFAPNDLTMVSKLACTKLAQILNAIEAGAGWPSDSLHGKGAFLAKDPNDLDDEWITYPFCVCVPILISAILF